MRHVLVTLLANGNITLHLVVQSGQVEPGHRELQMLCDRDQAAFVLIVLRDSSGLPRGPGVILPGTDL